MSGTYSKLKLGPTSQSTIQEVANPQKALITDSD